MTRDIDPDPMIKEAAGPRSRASRAPTSLSSPVMDRARAMGLVTSDTQQVGARLPKKLLEKARSRTGILSTTDLLTFALANVAIEDAFASAFSAARGKIDPDIEIGF